MGSEINIYEATADDFDSEGLCPLIPTDWEFATGNCVLTMKHPYDREGRFRLIKRGRILKAEVPVRSVPEIQNGAVIATAEKWTVKDTATKAERYQYSKAKGGRKMKCLPAGYEVMVVKKGEDRYKIKSSKYGSGWISHDALELEITDVPYGTNAEIEAVTPSVDVRPQLFRISDIQRGSSEITVTAWHISYDLSGNITSYKNAGAFTAQELLDGLIENCIKDHDFTAVTDIGDTRTGIDLTRVNPTYGMMDPENGFTARFGGEIIRDNFELTILRRAGMDRGFTVEYARNMTRIEAEESSDGVVTGIIPVGKTKDGEDLLLEGQIWIDAPNASEAAVPNIVVLDVGEAQVGDGVSTELARARMVEAVEAEWSKGVHLPALELTVEFEKLGDAAEYASFRQLEKCYQYDTVRVYHADICGEQSLDVVDMTWNGMKRRFTKCSLGVLGESLSNSKITNAQLPSNINGLRIANGTVGSAQLGSNVIATRHIQSESINTEALQTESVTAEKIATGSVNAEKIAAGVLEAGALEAVTGHIEKLTAGDITTDRLAAALATFTVITAGNAEFDRATIQHLVANALNLSFGVGDEVFIKNLKVIYAQMVSAAIGNLVIKASDGNYYEIDVDANGNVSATLSTVTDGEISAGMTDAGKVILGTEITAESLNTANLLATYALVNKIDASRLDVDTLWARDAFIARLETADISSNSTIRIMAERMDGVEEKNNAVYEALQSGELKGEQGIQGPQGEPGADGEPGQTTYFHIKYAPVENPTADQMSENPNIYIGTYADFTLADSTDPADYTWARFQGLQGEDGEQGIPGQNGENGLTSYLHIKYSDDGGETFTGSNGEDVGSWIGQYVDYTLADSTDPADYKWAKIEGNGVSGIKAQYYLSTSKETPTDGEWVYAMPAWEFGLYVWHRSEITYSDGEIAYTEPWCDTGWEAANDAQNAANNAGAMAAAAVEAIGAIPNYVEVGDDGLYLKDQYGASTLKINSASVSIGTVAGSAADGYSQLAANYVQFGNYQLRKSADGGLVFKLKG